MLLELTGLRKDTMLFLGLRGRWKCEVCEWSLWLSPRPRGAQETSGEALSGLPDSPEGSREVRCGVGRGDVTGLLGTEQLDRAERRPILAAWSTAGEGSVPQDGPERMPEATEPGGGHTRPWQPASHSQNDCLGINNPAGFSERGLGLPAPARLPAPHIFLVLVQGGTKPLVGTQPPWAGAETTSFCGTASCRPPARWQHTPRKPAEASAGQGPSPGGRSAEGRPGLCWPLRSSSHSSAWRLPQPSSHPPHAWRRRHTRGRTHAHTFPHAPKHRVGHTCLHTHARTGTPSWSECLCPANVPMLKSPPSMCRCWEVGLRELIQVRWGREGETPMIGLAFL